MKYNIAKRKRTRSDPLRRKKDNERRRKSDQANIEGRRSRDRNRTARKKFAAGFHSAADVEALFENQDRKCAVCFLAVTVATRHVDHIHPLARGGSNDVANLQILCAPCNMSKGCKDMNSWVRERDALSCGNLNAQASISSPH